MPLDLRAFYFNLITILVDIGFWVVTLTIIIFEISFEVLLVKMR